METKQTIENIKDTFLVGLSGVFKISEILRNPWKYKVSKYSIIAAIALPILALVAKLDLPKLIDEIQSQMIVFLPCILGFTIAGYSLVVGFVQSNMLNKISEPSKDSKFSLYQTMSSKFAINVILQGIALIIAYLYHFIIYFDNNSKINIRPSGCLLCLINVCGMAIIAFWFTISVLLVIQIVVNIFNFSQLHHYFVNIEKVREKESNANKDPI